MSDFYREHIEPGYEYCLEDGYQHWTVADLIEILSEYPPQAKVWVVQYPAEGHTETYRPVEIMRGDGNNLELG